MAHRFHVEHLAVEMPKDPRYGSQLNLTSWSESDTDQPSVHSFVIDRADTEALVLALQDQISGMEVRDLTQAHFGLSWEFRNPHRAEPYWMVDLRKPLGHIWQVGATMDVRSNEKRFRSWTEALTQLHLSLAERQIDDQA